MRPAFLPVCLAACLTATACSKTTLDLRNGQAVNVEIERADAEHVYVILEEPLSQERAAAVAPYAEARMDPEGERGEGRRLFRIPHHAVEGMTFPGRAAGITGTVLMTVGLGAALAGIVQGENCGGDFCSFYHAFFTLPGGILFIGGVATMIPGWVIYANAAAQAQPVQTVRLHPHVSSEHGGVAATASW